LFIHIGNRKIVSDKRIIGIFNAETLRLSTDNSMYLEDFTSDDKTIIIMRNNSILTSKISPFTVVKRTVLEDAIWRRHYE
jgi:regulator of extracellular matrix RemA (YlzA/DUF370 family)